MCTAVKLLCFLTWTRKCFNSQRKIGYHSTLIKKKSTDKTVNTTKSCRTMIHFMLEEYTLLTQIDAVKSYWCGQKYPPLILVPIKNDATGFKLKFEGDEK